MHIDYMIGTSRIRVVRREQVETTSDHDVVMYEIETDQPRDECSIPKLRTLNGEDLAPADWDEVWTKNVEERFQRELKEGDVDRAWTTLSDAIEDAKRAESDGNGRRRSKVRRPTKGTRTSSRAEIARTTTLARL